MAVKPDSKMGFSAGVKYWLFFMLCFVFLGYTPFLSITFGAIGGLAGGMIVAWLNPKEDYVTIEEKQAKEEENLPEPTGKRVRFSKYQALPTRRLRPSRTIHRLTSLFRRK